MLNKAVASRGARRLLEQQRQERAFRLSQPERARQCQLEPGLPSVPELDEERAVDAARGMDQTPRPVPKRPSAQDQPQDTRCGGRTERGCVRSKPRRAVADSLAGR